MFEDFLKEYIKDLIECSFDKYYITDSELDKIAHSVNNNEYIWAVLDEAIYFEIEKYKIENGGEEND